MKTQITFLMLLLACCLIQPSFAQNDEKIMSLSPTLYYSFENPDDYTAPAVGNSPLEPYLRGDDNTIGIPYERINTLLPLIPVIPVVGPTAAKKAVTIPGGLNFKVINPLPTEGGLLSYSLLFDIQVSDLSNWKALFQPTLENNHWCALYIDPSGGKIGKEEYSASIININQWYRVVLTLEVNESGGNEYKVYVDGNLILSNSFTGSIIDSDYISIKDYFWIFTDSEAAWDNELDCANFSFWNRTLTGEEIAGLGALPVEPYSGTPYEGIIPNIPEDIIEAEFFDEGGYRVAYYVVNTEEGGVKNSIRQDVNIPIRDDGPFGDYIILKNKEWTAYTINVTKTEAYTLSFGTARTGSDGKLSVFLDNDLLGIINIQPNEEWDYALNLSGISLDEGQHLFKIRYDGTGSCAFSDVFIEESNIEKTPALRYDFEDPSDLAKPTIGEIPLEFWQRGSDNTIGTPGAPAPALADGPTANKKAVYITPELNLKVVNPQVTEDGLLNYAIVIDFKVPELLEWNAIFQPVTENDADAFLYLNYEKIGKRAYSGNISANTWHRLILNAGNENSVWSYKVYIDGNLATDMSGNVSSAEVGLKDFFWLFTTNEGQYDFDWYCSGITLFTRTLTKIEIRALGNPTAIKKIETPTGKVYAENGKLHVEGFSASASVEVYNLVGQKIVAAKSLNGKTVDVPKGLYLVKVTDKGRTVSYKVVVK